MNVLFTTLVFATLCSHAGRALAQDAGPVDEAEAEAYLFRMEELDGLRIDINRASVEELQVLPWITQGLARRLVSARNRLGGFRARSDLSRIEGITPELLSAIDPYLKWSGPPGLGIRYTGRFSRPAGRPDTWDGLRLYHRLQVSMADRAEAFLLVERDPAEPSVADFATGHVRIRDSSGTAGLVAGDLRPGFSQGLVLSRQTRTGSDLASVRAASTRRIAYTSSQESGVMRGLCVLYSGKDYALTAFLARARWDADIDEAGVASVKRSGEHRSTAQIQRKGALSEKTAGARIAIAVPGGAIGLAGLRSTYSAPLPAFGGPSARRACVSADWRVGGPWGTVFGEYARALAGPAAGLVGTRLAAGRLRLALLIRNYQRGFNSMRGRAFSAYSGPPGNERGLYVGGAWRPVAGTLVEAGLDRHGRIEPAGNTPVPERGNRLSLKTTRRVGRSSEIRVDFRHDAETVAVRDHTGLRVRRRLRIRIRMARGPLTVRPWASAGRSSSPGGGGPARAVGLLAGLGASGGTRLDGWIALFRVSHYDARIYTATPDVWGGSRLSVLSGTGAIAGARLTVRLGSLQVSGRLDWKNTEARRTTSWAIQVGLDRNR